MKFKFPLELVLTIILSCMLGCTNNLEHYQEYTYTKREDFKKMWDTLAIGMDRTSSDSIQTRLDSMLQSGIGSMELIQLSLLDLGDPYFFRHTDSALANKIISNLSIESEPTFIIAKPIMDSLVYRFSKKLPTLKTPLIEDQIWDVDYIFRINRMHPGAYDLKPDVPGEYLNRIRSIRISDLFYSEFQNNGDSILSPIERIHDEQTRMSIHFKLLLKTSEIEELSSKQTCFRILADTFIAVCQRSEGLSNLEKATFILACAKIPMTAREYSLDYVYRLLKLAEGFVALEPENSIWLAKIRAIQFQFLLHAKAEWQKEMLIDAYYEINDSHHPSEFDNPDTLENQEYVRNLLHTIQFQLKHLGEDVQKKGQHTHGLLNMASYIYTLNSFLADGEFSRDTNLQCQYLLVLSDYHRLALELDKALMCLYRALEIQLQSSDPILPTKVSETTILIEYLLKDMGEPSDSVYTEWGYRFFRFPFQIPRDSRLWNEYHYDTLKSHLRHINVDRHTWDYTFLPHTNHTLKDVLKKVGVHEAQLNNGTEAYRFLSKADSAETFFYDDLSEISKSGAENKNVARQYYMDRKLEDSRRQLYIVLTAMACILALGSVAFYQWARAGREARFSEYKSHVWQELGHLPGSSIDDAYFKLQKVGVGRSDLSSLEELKEVINALFTSLAKGDSRKGNLIQDEINLADRYIQYKNRIHHTNITLESAGIQAVNLPPALLLSCVRNAIEHGHLLDQPNPKILIRLEQRNRFNIISVMNNGERFSKERLNPKGLMASSTGFKNIRKVLSYFNHGTWIGNAVVWRNIDNDGYTVQTILKVAL